MTTAAVDDTRRGFSDFTLYSIAIVVYAVCAAWTIRMARGMGGGMPMPGGWTMSMVWMRTAGQSTLAAAAMFSAMWAAMMVAMMLPSVWPMISIYRKVVRFRREPAAEALPWVMAAAYFGVWVLFGCVAYAGGVVLAQSAMQSPALSRSVPLVGGVGLIIGGVYQLTPWKLACLHHCRDPLHFISDHLREGWTGALGLGIHHGAFCVACCWALMLIQIVLGVMSLPAMAAVAAVIAAEKLLPWPMVIPRAVGALAVLAGAVYVARDLM